MSFRTVNLDARASSVPRMSFVPARKTDIFVNESFGRLSAIMRSVAMHGSLSVRMTEKSAKPI